MSDVLVLGSGQQEVRELEGSLGAELLVVPGGSSASDLEAWRVAVTAGPPLDRIVVAPWAEVGLRGPLVGVDLDDWTARAEAALARWIAALGVAQARCADGGTIVAVVDRPPPLDCAGWAPESGVADAVEALVRSLARSEGPRGVRVNAVTTPVRLAELPVVDPAPPLTTFPGSVHTEVVGAVRMLLSPDAAGITGTILHADCGRSWR